MLTSWIRAEPRRMLRASTLAWYGTPLASRSMTSWLQLWKGMGMGEGGGKGTGGVREGGQEEGGAGAEGREGEEVVSVCPGL